MSNVKIGFNVKMKVTLDKSNKNLTLEYETIIQPLTMYHE